MTNYSKQWDVYLRDAEGNEEVPVRVEGEPQPDSGGFLTFFLPGDDSLNDDRTAMFPSVAIRKVLRVAE